MKTPTLKKAFRGLPYKLSSLLVRQSLLTDLPDYRFKTFFKSRWVFELRFGSTKAHIDELLYILQVSHCLQGVPGISPFLGLVFDEKNVISGFMTELPAKGNLSREISKNGVPAAWTRRERWCRQIVQAVAEVHSRGFVIGSLTELPAGTVAIDGNDDAVLFHRFQTTILNQTTNEGNLPPECRRDASLGSQIKALPQTDIFQLGLLLWRIAIEIITACRAENPDERLPAWKLVEMFPPQAAKVTQRAAMPTEDVGTFKHLLTPEDCEDSYKMMCWCDVCGINTYDHYFECATCNSGDFDLCPRCIAEGVHCYGPEHYLREYSEDMRESRYHSRVKETGRREVIVL
ncbi:hypothetical protein F5Y19DRAFT_487644 [Xylariaceae sp. FL1651]|nr:hypothetical protein F5Y19DRAFT_487644 [Xylariaceae sp. FL1651]